MGMSEKDLEGVVQKNWESIQSHLRADISLAFTMGDGDMLFLTAVHNTQVMQRVAKVSFSEVYKTIKEHAGELAITEEGVRERFSWYNEHGWLRYEDNQVYPLVLGVRLLYLFQYLQQLFIQIQGEKQVDDMLGSLFAQAKGQLN